MALLMSGHYCAGKHPVTSLFFSFLGVWVVFGTYNIIWNKNVEYGHDQGTGVRPEALSFFSK